MIRSSLHKDKVVAIYQSITDTPPPLHYDYETSDMTSEGLWEMFEGDSADTRARKFLLTSMRG